MGLQHMKDRLGKGGTTLYGEQIKDAQEMLEAGFEDDVSYNPNIVSYDTQAKVPIKMYGQAFSSSYGVTSEFLALYKNPVKPGDMFIDTETNDYWLCVESYDRAGVYMAGKLAKCFRWLRWQDKNGDIQSIPIIVTSASKYNNGESTTESLVLGSDRLLIFMQKNENTVRIDRGKKFFIDENMQNPTTYEATRIDTALYTYMGEGFMSMILTECAYSPTEDDLRYGVCDYVAPNTTENDHETVILTGDINAEIRGNRKLKVGFTRTYIANLVDSDGNIVEWSDEFSWNIASDIEVTSTIDGNHIELLIDDEDCIDSAFCLQVLSGDSTIAQIEITVVGVF